MIYYLYCDNNMEQIREYFEKITKLSDQEWNFFSSKLTRVVKPKFKNTSKHDSFDNYISKKEVMEAKLELWEIIKPV